MNAVRKFSSGNQSVELQAGLAADPSDKHLQRTRPADSAWLASE